MNRFIERSGTSSASRFAEQGVLPWRCSRVSHRRAHSTPGINIAALDEALRAGAGLGAGHFRSIQRRQLAPLDDFRVGHHAYITASIILQLMTVVFHTSKVAKRG